MLMKDDGPRIDSSPETDTELDHSAIVDSNFSVNSVGLAVDNNGQGNNNNNLTPKDKENNTPTTNTPTMPNNRKKKAPVKKRKARKAAPKPTNDTAAKDPSDDPPRKKIANPFEMEAATQLGCDSDGWEGPACGTDPTEVKLLDEEVVGKVGKGITEPVFVPIAEDALKKLTVNNIKKDLRIRNVGMPRSKKKASLLAHLKDALAQKVPVFPVDQITTTKGDDMADFAVGAEWKGLMPDVDVD